MRTSRVSASIVLGLVILPPAWGQAADDSKVKAATEQVESGAKDIGEGNVVEGTKETAQGVGNTVVEGAKFTGEKLKESAESAEPHAKSAWQNVRQSAVEFGHSVKNFFGNLFSD